MRNFKILTLALALPLAGCQTEWPTLPAFGPTKDELAARKVVLAAKDDETCRSYGAKPGSDIYIQCRMTQQQSRDAADNAAASAPVIVNNVNPEPASYPKLQPIIIPGPRCTSRGC